MTAVVFDNKSIDIELEAGKEYYFCPCKESSNQPFCDGSYSVIPDEEIGRKIVC